MIARADQSHMFKTSKAKSQPIVYDQEIVRSMWLHYIIPLQCLMQCSCFLQTDLTSGPMQVMAGAANAVVVQPGVVQQAAQPGVVQQAAQPVLVQQAAQPGVVQQAAQHGVVQQAVQPGVVSAGCPARAG